MPALQSCLQLTNDIRGAQSKLGILHSSTKRGDLWIHSCWTTSDVWLFFFVFDWFGDMTYLMNHIMFPFLESGGSILQGVAWWHSHCRVRRRAGLTHLSNKPENPSPSPSLQQAFSKEIPLVFWLNCSFLIVHTSDFSDHKIFVHDVSHHDFGWMDFGVFRSKIAVANILNQGSMFIPRIS